MRKEKSETDAGESDERAAEKSTTAGGQSTASQTSTGAATDAGASQNGSTGRSTGDSSPTGAAESSSKPGATTSARSTGESGERGSSNPGGQTARQSDGRSNPRAAGGAASRQPSGTPGRGAQKTDSEFSFPVMQGAIYGAIAFVINYAAVFGMFMYEMSEQTGQYTTEQFEVHELAGWVFYGSHNVKIQPSSGGESFNYLETIYSTLGDASTLPKIAYYVVPAVTLFLVGRLVAQKAVSSRPLADGERLKAGATVAVGYAALAVAAAATIFSVTFDGPQSASVEPKLQSAVIFMGLAYPVVAGGLGGYFAD